MPNERQLTRLLRACLALSLVLGAGIARAQDVTARSDDIGAPKAAPKTPRQEWVWANAEGGVAVANLRTFNANVDTLSVGLVPSSGVGPAVGLGAGVRLLFITLGLRGRLNAMQSSAGAWQLWTLDAEIGAHVPLGRVEPYMSLAAGYASIGGFGTAINGLGAGLDISGANVRLAAGVDVYITRGFTVGGMMSGEALFLARAGVPLRDLAVAQQVGTIDEAKARVLEANGTSFGGALTFAVVAGLHF